MTTVHASAALVGEAGVLIRGDSGSGKSTLLLEILTADPHGTRLVADDRVILTALNDRILADVPAEIAGLMEIRGVGLVRRPHVAPVVVRLVVDLRPAETCPRMPEAAESVVELHRVAVPRLTLPSGATANRERVVAAIGAIGAGPG